MDKVTAFVACFVVACLCATVGIFAYKVGVDAEKAVLSLISGGCGLVTGGGAVLLTQKLTKGGEDES